jgi:trimeric autotransporter adhesin
MKTTKLFTLIVLFACLAGTLSAAVPLGTAFTYTGRLNDGGTLTTGLYDFKLSLYDAESGPIQIGSTLNKTDVGVTNGLFMVALDFGAGIFAGNARWLEIEVKTNGAADFTLLSPRQELTPAPYALYTPRAAAATTATNVIAGAVVNSSLGVGAVTSDKVSDGTLQSADLNLSSFNTTFWEADGNAGTTPGTHFLGTTDSQDLWLKVNNQVGWRLLRSSASATEPNIAGGGPGNQISSSAKGSGIAAGNSNAIPLGLYYASIGGGWSNQITYLSPYGYGDYGVIGGGRFNFSVGEGSVIGGGVRNTNYGDYATIGGGAVNSTASEYATIGGGTNNTVQASAKNSTIGGGLTNTVQSGAAESTIGGGWNNTIQTNAYRSTIAGGYNNTIELGASRATIGGGERNKIQPGAVYATIAGGEQNTIQTNANNSVIGGGYNNIIEPDAWRATIAGGHDNTIQTNADNSVIAGGAENRVQTNAQYATIAGGYRNEIGTNSFYSVIAGGADHDILSKADYATIPGGRWNSATNYAFAAGRQAKANHTGAFVWADSTGTDFPSTAPNQFLIRAEGGVGIGTNNPQSELHVAGMATANGFVGKFFGDGSMLTNFSATLTGTNFAGDGYYLTNLNAANITYGQLPDARLSGNVARRSGGNAFTGNQTVTAGTLQCDRTFFSGGGGVGYTFTAAARLAGVAAKGVYEESISGDAINSGYLGGEDFGVMSDGNLIVTNGAVGIGTNSPNCSLEVVGGIRARGGAPGALGANNNGYAFLGGGSGDNDSGMFSSADGQLEFYANATERMRITSGGYVGIGTDNPQSRLHVNGTASVNVLQILGGSDIAEPFHLSARNIPKGAVVIIDEANPGQLKLSERAYDTRVAGIVSGANGVKPGLTLSQQGVMEGTDNVALSGRVYALADASNGAIQPGDLLTTADTPGHAMKVTNHAIAQGAIIGKAMSSLKAGKGMVLVLVSLQ